MAGEHDLDIGITISKSGAGAEQAAGELAQVKDAAKQASVAIRDHGGAHENMREKISGAKDAVRSIGALMKGDLGTAISSAGLAVKGISAGFLAFTGIGAVVSVLAGAFVGFAQKVIEARKQHLEFVENFRRGQAEAAAASKFEAAIAELGKLTKAEQDAAAAADELRTARNKLRDASAAVEQARLDAEEGAALAGATSPEQREQIKLDYAQRRVNLEQEIEQAKAAGAVKDAESAIYQQQTIEAGAREDLGAARKVYGSSASARAGTAAAATKAGFNMEAYMGADDAGRKAMRAQMLAEADIVGAETKTENFGMGGATVRKTPEQLAADRARAEAMRAAAKSLVDYPQQVDQEKAAERKLAEQTQASNAIIAQARTKRAASEMDLQAAQFNQTRVEAVFQRKQSDVSVAGTEYGEKVGAQYRAGLLRDAEGQLSGNQDKLRGLASRAGVMATGEAQEARNGNVQQRGEADFARQLQQTIQDAASGGDTAAAMQMLQKALTSRDDDIRGFAQEALSTMQSVSAEMKRLREAMATLQKDVP